MQKRLYQLILQSEFEIMREGKAPKMDKFLEIRRINTKLFRKRWS